MREWKSNHLESSKNYMDQPFICKKDRKLWNENWLSDPVNYSRISADIKTGNVFAGINKNVSFLQLWWRLKKTAPISKEKSEMWSATRITNHFLPSARECLSKLSTKISSFFTTYRKCRCDEGAAHSAAVRRRRMCGVPAALALPYNHWNNVR